MTKVTQTSTDRLRSVLDSLPSAIIAVNEDEEIFLANKEAERFFGLQSEALVGRRLNESVGYAEIVQNVIKTGQPRKARQTLNGQNTFVGCYPISDAGTITGAVIIIQPLSKADSTYIGSEDVRKLDLQLEAIIETSYDGIGVVDKHGYLVRVNRGYERITGLRREEVQGRHLSELVDKGIISVAPSLHAIERRETITALQKVKTGAEVLITASPLFNEAGEVEMVIGNIRDITDLNRLKEENARYRDLAERYRRELQELRGRTKFKEEIIAESTAMKRVVELAMRAAQASCNVLITGETGVGKEVVSRLIHQTSSRCQGPFVQINCAAIPATLLESELFGYEPGAFSGALRTGKIGFFELANGGTLLLDEIGEMPLDLQTKLLRVLQDRIIYRVGGTKPIKIDVRVIAATNEDLKRKIEQKQFRHDLFYRLNVIHITIPPLRERREDILPLALFFLNKFNSQYGTNKRLAIECQAILEGYAWPGNVRELENLVERLVVMEEKSLITADDIRLALGDATDSNIRPITVNGLIPLPQAHALVEEELLRQALRRYKSARQIAKALQVTHPTVLKKIAQYGLVSALHEHDLLDSTTGTKFARTCRRSRRSKSKRE